MNEIQLFPDKMVKRIVLSNSVRHHYLRTKSTDRYVPPEFPQHGSKNGTKKESSTRTESILIIATNYNAVEILEIVL